MILTMNGPLGICKVLLLMLEETPQSNTRLLIPSPSVKKIHPYCHPTENCNVRQAGLIYEKNSVVQKLKRQF